MRVLKFLFFAVLFIYLVILFLPKENFYYFAEEQLAKYKIALNNESVKDSYGVLSVDNISVSYGGENVAYIENAGVLPFIVYNEIDIKNVNVSKNFKSFIPSEIEAVSLKATVFFPVKVWINAKGDFGRIHGSYNIYSKTIRLVLEPENGFAGKYPLIYRNFKDTEGQLVYESSF
jgi:hypothetical protein